MENDPLQLVKTMCILFEGVYLKPYLDPVGIPTIGIGTIRYENGLRVTLSDPAITRQRAEDLLMWELQKDCLPRILKLCANLKGWGPKSLAAILDFTYNLGSGNLSVSTLRKKILADDKEGTKTELMKWVRGGGKVLPGLVRRRGAEAALIG